MSKNTSEQVEESYESLTRLARPGDWPRATEEVDSSTSFADGVLGDKIVHYYHYHNSHVKGHGWTFYEGTQSSEYDMYIEVNDLPQSWTAFGCNNDDGSKMIEAFESNPFMLEPNY